MVTPSPTGPLGPPLLGRAAELARLRSRAAAPRGAVVTVTGPVGAGKTALVRAFADEIAAGGGRVVWVELADATRVELARATLRGALGVPADLPTERVGRERSWLGQRSRAELARPWAAGPGRAAAGGGGEAAGSVSLGPSSERSEARSDRGVLGAAGEPVPALVVVDGADAVARGLAAELAGWARDLDGRGLVVVTTGLRLHVAAEDVVALGGLDEADGARLLERFAGPVPASSARRISAALDGLPLALVHAGVRAATLGVDAVAARLDDALRLLAAPLAGAPQRHQSVRAAMGVAWSLLEPPARRALAACAAFAGTFELAGAEAVIGADGPAEPDPLEALSALVDASWLGVVADGPVRRFRAHPLARAYAAEAEPGAAATGRRRHRAWFAARAEEAWRGAERGSMGAWRERVRRDAEDLWRVMGEADGDGRVHAALALGLVAADRDTETQLACASAGLSADPEGELSARLLELRARAQRGRGRPADALADLDAAVASARGTPALPLVLAQRAVTRVHLADLAGAAADAVAAEGALGPDTPPFLRLVAHATAAFLDYRAGDVGRAEPALERALGEATAVGAGAHAAELAGILGNLAHLAGRLDAARERLAAAARSAEGEGAARLAAIFDGYVALVDHEAGRLDAARAGYDAVIEALDRFGSRRHEALFRAARAGLLATVGREPELGRADLATAAHLAAGLASPELDAVIACFRRVARARWDGEAAATAAPLGPAPPDDDVVVARRITAAALATLGAAPVLLLSADGARARPGPDGEIVDLSRRPPLRRVLAALVSAHAAEPGRTVDADDLREAGWPGERMLDDAGRQRVRVAVWTLRKLGLKELIETEGGAYRLRPDVVLGALP